MSRHRHRTVNRFGQHEGAQIQYDLERRVKKCEKKLLETSAAASAIEQFGYTVDRVYFIDLIVMNRVFGEALIINPQKYTVSVPNARKFLAYISGPIVKIYVNNQHQISVPFDIKPGDVITFSLEEKIKSFQHSIGTFIIAYNV